MITLVANGIRYEGSGGFFKVFVQKTEWTRGAYYCSYVYERTICIPTSYRGDRRVKALENALEVARLCADYGREVTS